MLEMAAPQPSGKCIARGPVMNRIVNPGIADVAGEEAKPNRYATTQAAHQRRWQRREQDEARQPGCQEIAVQAHRRSAERVAVMIQVLGGETIHVPTKACVVHGPSMHAVLGGGPRKEAGAEPKQWGDWSHDPTVEQPTGPAPSALYPWGQSLSVRPAPAPRAREVAELGT